MNYSDYGVFIKHDRSGWQKTACPECARDGKPRNSNLSVNVDIGYWHCFRCGWNGYLDQEKYKMKKVYTKPAWRKPTYDNVLMSYLEDRGISCDTQTKMNLSFENNAIVFNYFMGGELVNRKYRTQDKSKLWMETGAELVMYQPKKNYNTHAKYITITEGEIDAITLYECGITNVISVPNGAPPINSSIEKHDFSYLSSLKMLFPEAKRFMLCMDNDEVGTRLRDELARRLGFENCEKVEYPDGCKDVNDVIVKHGKEAVHECLRNSEGYPISGLHDVESFEQSVLDFYDNGFMPGVNTGWPSVDAIYTPRRKEFSIITGIPSHGKSVWLDNLMVNVARTSNWKFAVFSPENAPIQRHMANLLEIIVGKPFDKQYNGFMSRDEVVKGLDFLRDHFFFLKPEGDSFTIDEILSIGRAAVFKYGVNGFVIDPYNEIDHNRGQMSETDYISKFLSKVRNFSRDNDVHVWVVAHPTKLFKEKTTGEYPIPTPYDISGSAHWRNKADCCLCVYRNFDEKITEIHVQKIRFKECGKIGMAPLLFDIRNSRFKEL